MTIRAKRSESGNKPIAVLGLVLVVAGTYSEAGVAQTFIPESITKLAMRHFNREPAGFQGEPQAEEMAEIFKALADSQARCVARLDEIAEEGAKWRNRSLGVAIIGTIAGALVVPGLAAS